ncbi:winged helix-turn-helix transcriptional regulator [Nonomuraea sp. K274]|uniref:Winged helix-turn-helix transcriptional regulator n=1 Tax=Nonomuraea cypriaca TaxID=1187855 RepID=A0A931APZ4_9ACTN|nr:winged helix-turn-helix domain-containing protein [Nonomuraea cypriaca]MBF8192842.1 winged helix-turn-helix transcriptional regulator [Nonomuraea cypriaca]
MAGEQDIPEFDPEAVVATYVYAAMAEHIEARIKAGQMPPGARLSGERALAEEYGVALGTARRAIEELRNRGYVVTLPAKGTYVKPAEQWPEA